jgi:4-diphosphocytidyl-2-C-methyl-D-erythritol kinase
VEIPGLPAEADLCIRAAKALQSASGATLGADISLAKKIPVGGGLGGGSSDAATCLIALNHLWGLHWPREKLAAIGLKLGADVPVFVHGRVAWAEGVGERLTPLYPPLAPTEANYLILKPNVFVSTAAVFQDPELTRNSAPITIHGFLASGGRNDCLGVVRRRYPEVAHALDWLSVFGSARLTGTGACVFLACENKDLAQEILRKVPPEFEGFLARGLNDSPLLEGLRPG